jgi:hypothetical protein
LVYTVPIRDIQTQRISDEDAKSRSPTLWEKIVATAVAVLIVFLVAWLTIRNEPFRDPNLVVLIRIVLSVAVAVLGATIPGLLHVGWKAKGVAVRSAGALALFVVSFMWSPTVIQPSAAAPALPPLTSDEIAAIRAQALTLAAQIRTDFGPGAISAFRANIEPIANRVWADPRFAQEAPQASGQICRLYAATLLLDRPADGDVLRVVKSALPWLRKAVQLGDEGNDRHELVRSVAFLEQVASGQIATVDLSMMLRHLFRVAMPGAAPAEIEKHVQSNVRFAEGLIAPSPGGSSPKEDFDYLSQQKLGSSNVGLAMDVMRIMLKAKFPNVDVGGLPVFVPLPNGNTLVQYAFNNGMTTLTYEWEVSKARATILPKNDVTRELMRMRVGGP